MTAVVLQFSSMARAKPLANAPNRIREQRMKRGLSLAFIAERLNTTQTQISRFETGEREVTLNWLRRIAEALGTDMGQLLNPEDNPVSLDDRERGVIEAMRRGEPHVAKAVAQVADSLTAFDAAPAEDDRKSA